MNPLLKKSAFSGQLWWDQAQEEMDLVDHHICPVAGLWMKRDETSFHLFTNPQLGYRDSHSSLSEHKLPSNLGNNHTVAQACRERGSAFVQASSELTKSSKLVCVVCVCVRVLYVRKCAFTETRWRQQKYLFRGKWFGGLGEERQRWQQKKAKSLFSSCVFWCSCRTEQSLCVCWD